MTGKTARLIFWLGTLSSAAIFLWMTYDFHHQTPKYTEVEQLSTEVVAGKKVWHKYNCYLTWVKVNGGLAGVSTAPFIAIGPGTPVTL